MIDIVTQPSKTLCPICSEPYSSSSGFCAKCSWEFITTNQTTPAFEKYMQKKLELHRKLWQHARMLENDVADLEQLLFSTKAQLDKVDKRSRQRLKELKGQEKIISELQQINERLSKEIEQLKQEREASITEFLNRRIGSRTAIHEYTSSPIIIGYRLEERENLVVDFSKSHSSFPLLMQLCIARENPIRGGLGIGNAEFCINIRGNGPVEKNISYKFSLPPFLGAVDERLEGFLHLPIPGLYKINPNIKTIKF